MTADERRLSTRRSLPQAVIEVLVGLAVVERGSRFARLLRERLESARAPEPCPWCGCPGEQFDGHACEDYNEEKLIRDSYEQFASRTVTGDERIAALLAKLHEEVAEVMEAHASGFPHAFTEELGDVVEVCFALGGKASVESAREQKLIAVGGFEKGLVMRLADRTDK